MAKWQLRRSKKIGPLRLNFSKRGVSVSGGLKGARIAANSKGELHRTTGIPGTGLYKREKIRGRSVGKPAAQSIQLEMLDATGGNKELPDNDPDVESLDIVDLNKHLGGVAEIARFAGLTDQNPQGFRHAMLVPRDSEISVFVLVDPEENPSLFSRKEMKTAEPHGRQVGRLGANAARRLNELAGNVDALGVVHIDTRAKNGRIEVRVRRSELQADGALPPPPTEGSPPAPQW
jgi:hypothetical protein